MKANQTFKESISQLRDPNKEYSKRVVTLEESANNLLNKCYSLLYNKIENMVPYDRRDSGWLEVLDVIEDRFDKIQSLLKDMNDEVWERMEKEGLAKKQELEEKEREKEGSFGFDR